MESDRERFATQLSWLATRGTRFSGKDFRSWCGPLAYMFLRNGSALYIGMSRNGLSRPFGFHSRAIQAKEECDEVMFWPARTLKEAKALEVLMIRNLKPKYNMRVRNGDDVTARAAKLLGVGERALVKVIA